MVTYNKKLKHLSRVLRKNMTTSEIILWSKLRRKQLKGKQFYRQKVLLNFIVDFYCPSSKIIIQVDGSQHFSREGIMADKDQDNEMSKLGLRVLRFPSLEVMSNIDGVVSEILDNI